MERVGAIGLGEMVVGAILRRGEVFAFYFNHTHNHIDDHMENAIDILKMFAFFNCNTPSSFVYITTYRTP